MKLQEIARLKRRDARKLLNAIQGGKTRLPRKGHELIIQSLNTFMVILNSNGVFVIQGERGNP
jgi:hypothetical protein